MDDIAQNLLNIDWITSASFLAMNTGPFFFAIFCVSIGLFLIMRKTILARCVAIGFFTLSGSIIIYTVIKYKPTEYYVYEFSIVDLDRNITIEHGEQSAWLKSRDNQDSYRVISLRNEPFKDSDSVLIRFLVSGEPGELFRRPIPYCDVTSPQFGIKIEDQINEDSGEEVRNYKIKSINSDCDVDTAQNTELKPSIFENYFVTTATAQLAPAPAYNSGKLKWLNEQFYLKGGGKVLASTQQIELLYYRKDADFGRVGDIAETFDGEIFKIFDADGGPGLDFGVSVSGKHSRAQELATNAVWYGAEVPIDVAQIVAIKLITSGVELKYFGPYVFSDTRLNVIEIGYSRKNKENRILTIQDIKGYQP